MRAESRKKEREKIGENELESGNNNGSICFNVPVNRDPSFHPF